jgi:hypothetical protein
MLYGTEDDYVLAERTATSGTGKHEKFGQVQLLSIPIPHGLTVRLNKHT